MGLGSGLGYGISRGGVERRARERRSGEGLGAEPAAGFEGGEAAVLFLRLKGG